MLDLFLKLIERLTKFAEVRDKNSKDAFREFIQPMYEEAEAVAQNYHGLLSETAEKLIDYSIGTVEICDWLEQKRHEFLPVRIKLRAAIRSLGKTGDIETDKFVHGIGGLLGGGLSMMEHGHIVGSHARGHTLLDILTWVSRAAEDESFSNRRECLSAVRRQRDAIDGAWNQTSEAYFALKSRLYSLRRNP